ncbi:MAG: asparagine synthase C-terminal domain-containing protein, partial [Nitrospirales bacterium]|nr:asparagine synthase C-terminal domain-containing protein [Nitrospirales bacterium]
LMKGIRRIQPGSWRFYTGNVPFREKTYYQPYADKLAPQSPYPAKHQITNFRSIFDQAVKLSLRSDVPVGLFLSGGIDSALIAESAVRQGRLREAYCLDFTESEFSEWGTAKLVADHLGLTLHRVGLSSHDLVNFMDIVEYADDPLADSSALPLWILAKEASRNIKVVLSGDGGDEFFAGYLTFQASLLHKKFLVPLPSFLKTLLSHLALRIPTHEGKVSLSYQLMRFLRSATFPTGQAHFTWNGTWLPHELFKLLQVPHNSEAFSVLEKLANKHSLSKEIKLLNLQLSDVMDYLPNDILTKIDRMSMAHGLEVRAPLLNPQVAEFGLSLPDFHKIGLLGKPKRFLREVASSIFGSSFANAKKQGFSIPIHRWLKTPIGKELLQDLLSYQALSELGIFDAKTIISAKDKHLSGKRSLGFELWGLMVFMAWYRKRALKKPGLHTSDIPPSLVHVKAPSS